MSAAAASNDRYRTEHYRKYLIIIFGANNKHKYLVIDDELMSIMKRIELQNKKTFTPDYANQKWTQKKTQNTFVRILQFQKYSSLWHRPSIRIINYTRIKTILFRDLPLPMNKLSIVTVYFGDWKSSSVAAMALVKLK